jgi:hypothetical protein
MLGSPVALNGGGSFDKDGDDLTYTWSFVSLPSGSIAALSECTNVFPEFTTDKEGLYVVKLVVCDSY